MSVKSTVACVMAGVAMAVAGCERDVQVVDFDSCVLAHASDAPTQLAANMAYEACESSFKGAEGRKGRALEAAQLEAIAAEQIHSEYYDFVFQIYNGLSDLTLTEVTVEVQRRSDDRTWRFNMAVDIPPLTTGKDSFDVLDQVLYIDSDDTNAGGDRSSGFFPVFDHSVVGARGYPRE